MVHLPELLTGSEQKATLRSDHFAECSLNAAARSTSPALMPGMPAGSGAFVVDSLLLVTCHQTALNSAADHSRFLSYLHGSSGRTCLRANGDDAAVEDLI